MLLKGQGATAGTGFVVQPTAPATGAVIVEARPWGKSTGALPARTAGKASGRALRCHKPAPRNLQ
ncbi:hypothetical protein NA32_09990, partial [Streptococcus hongkongensis]